MTNSGTVDQVRAALAAFEAGKKTLAELEAALSAALHSGLWTPALIMNVLRNAVAAGRVPLEMLRRLGMEELGEATVARAVESFSNADSAALSPLRGESIAAGQLLAGRYRLERKLGEGGMGVVYLASDQEVKGEIFAVKVLTNEFRHSPEALKLLLEETRMTRALAHPNIVGVYSLNVDRNDVFILMEFLEGKTLQALLDQDFGRGMRFDRAWPIIEDMGAALAYAHDRSVIHGDLKPANVFVTTSGRAKLLDFGIARAARGSRKGTDTLARSALTPAYASCEMLEFEPPDTRDDIYALACIIYEMLSGKHPFGGRNAVDARNAGEKPTPIAALTNRQNATLAQGLAFDRAARTATVEMLIAGLAPVVNASKPRGPLSKGAWVATLLVVSAALVIAGALLWRSMHPTTENAHIGTTNPTAPELVKSESPAAIFAPPAHSIAVLPFVNMSGDPRQDYFSDGISQELLDSLSRLEELQVAARTSSFSFKGQNVDVATIAHKLNVGAVLEGSVRRAGNTVRVTVQVINAVTGFRIWSQTYDRQLTDILKVQTEVATAVAQQLEVKLAGSEAARLQVGSTSNPAAYDAYLRGVQLQIMASNNQSEVMTRAALAEFDRAVALDPEYSGAQAARARGLMQVALYEHDVTARNHELVEAIQAAERAVALAPNMGEAHLALGLAFARGQLDVGRAAPEMDRALSLAPGSAEVQASFADFSNDMRHFPSALQAARQAVRLDPRNVAIHLTLIDILTAQHKYDEATSALRIASELEPVSPRLAGSQANVLIASGQIAQAIKWCESTSTPLDNWARSACLALAYHASGRRDDAERELNTFKAIDGETSAIFYAGTYAQWGDRMAAIEWLKKAERMRDPMLTEVRADWEFDPLRDDPEFRAIEARMNFPP